MTPRRDGDPGDAREPGYPIRSVDRALLLLLLFREKSAISVTEASRQLGVARSTAHRLLAMLHQRDFVRQNERTKDYVAGPALVEAGLAAIRRVDLRQAARPHLEQLVHEVGESAHLLVLQSRYAFFFDGVESQQAVRAVQRAGLSLPAHCTAGGKVLLAELPRETLRALYDGVQLDRLTPSSIATFEKLERELEGVRKRGWAFNNGESEPGLRAVAVAIPDLSAHSPLRASITVAAPAFRLTDDRIEEIADAIAQSARRIANEQAVDSGSALPDSQPDRLGGS